MVDALSSARAAPSSGWSSTRFALITAVVAWSLYLAAALVRCLVYGVSHPVWVMQRHALTAAAAVAMAWLIHLLLDQLAQRPTRQRLAAAVLIVLPPAALLSIFNYNVMYVFAPATYLRDMGMMGGLNFVGEVLYSLVENCAIFAAWAVLVTAVSHAVQTQEILRRAADAQAAARASELRALRLQLDPHFLFNALNTVSGLIVAGQMQDAETTVEALSSFLRATLAADASADVSLADEVILQQLYLEIEQIRFGERLQVAWDIPTTLEAAAVPALILQPLVENTIRHAVARTSAAVRMRVSARANAGRLHLTVEDDGPGGGTTAGHGVGLANVANRLRLRYDGAASCEHGRHPSGLTRTALVLPLNLLGAAPAAAL